MDRKGRNFKKVLFIFFAIMVFQFASYANAGLIIDTGSGASGFSGSYLGGDQWIAAEFTIAEQYQITDIQAWLTIIIPGNLKYSIYTDGGNIPGSLLYSTTFFINGAYGSSSWYGPSGLSWDLTAGTYWVSFESASFIGDMPVATSPLFNYSVWGPYSGWQDLGDDIHVNSGVRIYGESTVAPEPATMLLLGFGLVGLAGLRRKLQK